MSQRLAVVILVTGAVLLPACSDDGAMAGTAMDKKDAEVDEPGDGDGDGDTKQDAASEDPETGDDAGGEPQMDASAEVDAGSDSGSGDPDASDESDAGPDASEPEPETLPLSAAGQVIITEIMAAPFTSTVPPDDLYGEWVEIYNPSANVTYELKNCTFSDKAGDSDFAFGDITIAPHSYLTLSATAFTTAVQGFVGDVVYGIKSKLGGDGDAPNIKCGTTYIDIVDYTVAGFPLPQDREGSTLQLSADALDGTQNDLGSKWCYATASYGTATVDTVEKTNYGTPKGANIVCPEVP